MHPERKVCKKIICEGQTHVFTFSGVTPELMRPHLPEGVNYYSVENSLDGNTHT